jgi:hypothetical protein
MSFKTSLVPLPKDTGHSCVFDFPDRGSRPTPPPGPPPLYPYDPVDDWNPADPNDNGVPGSANPPDHITNAFYVYASFHLQAALAYNCHLQSYKGDGVTIVGNTGPALDDMMVTDDTNANGGDENHSAISMASTLSGDFHIVLNFPRMKVRHPTVAVFDGGFFVNFGYVGNKTWTTIVKDIKGTWPTTSVIPVNITKDYSFGAYTSLLTFGPFDHFVIDGSIPLMGWTYTVATGICDLVFP